MSSETIRAAIYVRQSVANDEGIERGLAKCRQMVKTRGWTAVAEFAEDNGRSATKERGAGTDWARMIALYEAGGFDVLVGVEPTRIYRDPLESLQLQALGMTVYTLSGELDLTTANGQFTSLLHAALGQREQKDKSEKQQRANAFRAAQGQRTGASRRPFGYGPITHREKDAVTGGWKTVVDDPREVIEEEAAAVRDGYDALLSGVKLAAIARDWNGRGFATTQKRQARSGHAGDRSPWTAGSVRAVLMNPRNAAIVTYAPMVGPLRKRVPGPRQEMVGVEAEWPAIVAVETFRAASALLADPSRRTSQPRYGKYLLSGIARCGVEGCGGHAHAGGNARRGVPGYRCSASMGHFARMSEPVEDYVTRVILGRLARKDARDLLVKRGPDVKKLRREAITVERRIEELAELVADGTFTAAEARSASGKLRAKLSDIEAQIADAGRVDILGPLVTAAEAAGEAAAAAVWGAWDVDRRRAVVDMLMTVTLYPTGRGIRLREDDPRLADTIRIDWKGDGDDGDDGEPAPAPVAVLTPKPSAEEVAALLEEGWDRHRIAAQFGRPVRTVDKWIGAAYALTR